MVPAKRAPKGLSATDSTLGVLAASLAAFSCGPPALAAEAESRTSEGAELVEVLVTAQRRVERLQEVPISAQVVAGHTLAQQNLNSLTALAQTVPSVHISTNGRTNDMYIRGIGSGANQSFDQSVGMFIDDIYHGRSRISAATFLDIDRVEVLKGPQTTFFGNNAIAGAVNIETRRPGNTFDASTRALYGEDGQYALEGALGGPLGEKFGVRAAMIRSGQQGWIENITEGRHVPTENNLGGRLTFTFNPTENLDIALKAEGSRNRAVGSPARQIIDCPPKPPFTAPAGFCTQLLNLGLGSSTDLDNNDTTDDAGQVLNLDTEEYALRADYERWNHVFTAVSGYYDYDFIANFDSAGLPRQILHAQIPETYHQFSQEFRVTSPSHGKVEYMAGLYFQTDRLFARQNAGYFFVTVPTTNPLSSSLPIGQQYNFGQNEDSYAAFASLGWKVTERLKLSAGLRGTWVDKDFDFSLLYGTATQPYGGIVPVSGTLNPLPAAATGLQGNASALGLGRAGTAAGDRSDHAWLPSAKAQYQIAPDTMAYLSYNKGFKAGGFNGFDNTGDPTNLPFAPERVNAYEGGLKSEWLDNRVLLNLAVFRMNYRNLQVSTNVQNAAGAYISVVKNAAASRSQGVELEAQWAASRNLRLSATAAYVDAEYISYPNATLTSTQSYCRANPTNTICIARFPGGVGPVQDLSGQPTTFAPTWTGSLGGSYSMLLPREYRLVTELTGQFSSSYFLSNEDDENLQQGDFARLDGRLSLESPDSSLAIDLIGKNLTDRTILLIGNGLATSAGSYRVSKAQPRNVALQVRYRW